MTRVFTDRKRSCVACTHWASDGCDLGIPLSAIQDPDTFVCARNEIRPPDPEEHPARPGFFTRGWYDDPGMVSEAMRTARSLDIRPDDIVIDLGAHIGSFGVTALESGARTILAEADPINWPMLDLNTRRFENATVIKRAIVGEESSEGHVILWRTGYVGCSSILWRKRTYRTFVDTMSFHDLMAYKPTVVKIDVEGAEYTYDMHELPSTVRALHIEIHRPPGTGTHLEATDTTFLPVFIELGFTLKIRKDRMAFTSLHMER